MAIAHRSAGAGRPLQGSPSQPLLKREALLPERVVFFFGFCPSDGDHRGAQSTSSSHPQRGMDVDYPPFVPQPYA